MKIAFVITTTNLNNFGIGGHYYSLISTAEAMAEYHQIEIIHIGVIESKVLKKSILPIKNIISSKFNIRQIFPQLREYIAKFNPEILHAFDLSAHLFTRIIGFELRIPTFLTKCGGQNPKYYYPFAENLILYSEENFLFFSSRRTYNGSRISLIPNRVKMFNSDYFRIESLKKCYKLDQYDYILLRITRVGSMYMSSTLQFVELLRRLRNDKINCCLLIIGVIEDHDIKEKIKCLHEHIIIIDNPEFIIEAKELIDIADCVLGMGRGFMEATSKGKIMLAPCQNLTYPIFVDERNFNSIFKYNFSERYRNFEVDNEENYKKIVDALINNKNDNYRNFLQGVFTKYFSIATSITEMVKLYSDACIPNKLKNWDIFLNYLFVKRYVLFK